MKFNTNNYYSDNVKIGRNINKYSMTENDISKHNKLLSNNIYDLSKN